MEKEKKDKIKSYILAGLGFFLFVSFIYFRFIRERLPKIIPFELNAWTFYLLLYICIIYGIILLFRIILLFPSSGNKKKEEAFKEYVVSLALSPFFALESFIFSFKVTQTLYWRFLQNIDSYTFWLQKYKPMWRFHFLIYVIPRFVMAMVFFSDVFFFHMLVHIYTLSFLVFIFLLYRYIMYRFKNTLENEIERLDDHWLVEVTSEEPKDNGDFYFGIDEILWLDQSKYEDPRFDLEDLLVKKATGTLTRKEANHLEILLIPFTNERYRECDHTLEIKKFLLYQAYNRTNGCLEYKYKSRARIHVILEYEDAHGTFWAGIKKRLQEDGLDTEEDYLRIKETVGASVIDHTEEYWKALVAKASLNKDFDYLMPILISLSSIRETYESVTLRDPGVKLTMIYLTLLTFAGWLYILYVSFNGIYLNTFFSICDKIDPFSGLGL